MKLTKDQQVVIMKCVNSNPESVGQRGTIFEVLPFPKSPSYLVQLGPTHYCVATKVTPVREATSR